ncbi:unnamed protein product [Arabis nemorensis]|uniref:Uncharacterized protein n=1 Tax=Arabis nemorensis TaxID=586526 RepID=A0A565BH64_9BRAS|nr:unnamed protein product [Arabis nemorensis]
MTEDVVREILNITSEDITKLKKIIAEDEEITNEKEKNEVAVTSLEILEAHIWRARCRALKLNEEGTTVFGLFVRIRGVMDPPLPEGYYGNSFVNPSVALTVKELSESPLSRVVRLIADTKRAALDKRYVLGKLSEIERINLKEMALFKDNKGGWMTLTDWRQVGYQYDGLVNIIPLVPMRMTYFCILLPASQADPGMSGGARLLVTLPRGAMAMFKEEIKNAF